MLLRRTNERNIKQMKFTKISLRPDDESVYMDAYLPEPHKEIAIKSRRAIIVFPGGGYRFCSGRESDPVARKFLGEGFSVFVLYYSLCEKAREPRQLIDASMAVEHVRKNAEEYGVDPDKIFVCGFSAGGHLAASIGTLWHTDYAKTSPDMPYGINRPNGMILCYPVINTVKYLENSNEKGKIEYGDPDTDVGALTSQLDLQVKSGLTPPAYIWTTFEDTLVPPENSIHFALAMQKEKIPYELHVYKHGWHGLSLCTPEVDRSGKAQLFADVATWADEAAAWAKEL